jgi:hypothetical protein
MLVGCGATGTSHTAGGGVQNGAATQENNLAVSYRIKYTLTMIQKLHTLVFAK